MENSLIHSRESMEPETERKIEETVKGLLREADLDEMTEFKLRDAASARLGLDLSAIQYKKLVRTVMESFLLSTADETADDGETPVAETTVRDEAVAVKKEIGAGSSDVGEDERIICKLSDKKNAVVHVVRGKAFLSVGERSLENGTQPPTFRGISLTTDQWSVIKKNFPAIEETIKNLQSKLRSQSNAKQKEDASDAVDDNAYGLLPLETSRFDGKNYLCWASQMELFLKQLKLAYVLDEPGPSSSTGPETPEEITKAKAAKQKWINDDRLCRHHLLNSLSDHLYHQYSKKFRTAKELWDELKGVYLYEESGSRRSQVRKYIEFKMVEERPILEQVQDFNKIADAIVSAGMFLDENFHTSAIISKFPPSWKGFCIKLMQEEFLPVWMLMERVKAEEELRKNGMQGDTSRLTGFHVDRRQPSTETRHRGKQNIGWKRKEPERDGRPVIICNNCGKKGHLTKNCWGKKSDKGVTEKPSGNSSAASILHETNTAAIQRKGTDRLKDEKL